MKKDLAVFIHDHIDDIDAGNFQWVYEKWYDNVYDQSGIARIYELTDVLLQAEINPLYDMLVVPSGYANMMRGGTIIVPKNILKLREFSLLGCQGTTIFLPNIPLANIERGAIQNCHYCTVYYAGTQSEFKAYEDKEFLRYCTLFTINCKDGQIERLA